MALWDKVRQGIDKAGKAAQGAIDEGKLRLDAYRAREQADKAAEALGYAVYRALEGGRELETEARDRLVTALRARENEAKKLEAELAAARANNPDMDSTGTSSAAGTAGTSSASTETPGGSTSPGAAPPPGGSSPGGFPPPGGSAPPGGTGSSGP